MSHWTITPFDTHQSQSFTTAAASQHLSESTTMVDSLLMLLPGELRNRIWRYTIIDDDKIIVKHDQRHLGEPSLLAVSQEIRRECIDIYYGENKFQVECCFDTPLARLHWLENLGHVRASKLQHATVEHCFSRTWDLGFDFWLQYVQEPIRMSRIIQCGRETMSRFASCGVDLEALSMAEPYTKEHSGDAKTILLKQGFDGALDNHKRLEKLDLGETLDAAYDR